MDRPHHHQIGSPRALPAGEAAVGSGPAGAFSRKPAATRSSTGMSHPRVSSETAPGRSPLYSVGGSWTGTPHAAPAPAGSASDASSPYPPRPGLHRPPRRRSGRVTPTRHPAVVGPVLSGRRPAGRSRGTLHDLGQADSGWVCADGRHPHLSLPVRPGVHAEREVCLWRMTGRAPTGSSAAPLPSPPELYACAGCGSSSSHRSRHSATSSGRTAVCFESGLRGRVPPCFCRKAS